MRILVDLRCLQAPPPRGGVAVYAEQLVRALIAHANAECRMQNAKLYEFILFANASVRPRKYLPTIEAPNVRWTVGHLPNKILNLNFAFHIHHSAFHGADVVFLPNLNFVPPLPARTRLVVTVHDLSFEHFADCFTWKQRLWHRAIQPRALLARADAIIAVSETTKQDVMETYGVPEGKVRVVHPGVDAPTPPHPPSQGEGGKQFFSPPPDRRGSERGWNTHTLPDRFILTLSELSPRKNLDGLIVAFEQLITHHSSLITHLVLAGNHGSAERALRRQISLSPARDRIHLMGPVTENEKHALLARASCFVYPSLWEGFGFPPLEAMAAGVPVVASTGGALPEVLGDASPRRMTGAALLVDPLDPAAIANAIARVLTDDTLRTDLIARGRTRAAHFRWDQAADRVDDILTSVIRGNP